MIALNMRRKRRILQFSLIQLSFFGVQLLLTVKFLLSVKVFIKEGVVIEGSVDIKQRQLLLRVNTSCY